MFPASPIRASRKRSRIPALKVDFNRELAGVVGLTENDASTSIQATLSGSTQTAPTYWLSPANGVSYAVSVQTPQYDIDTLGDLKYLPLTAAQSTQLLGGLATFSPEPLNAIVSHYDIRNTVNIYATTQDRDLGGVAADIQKIVDDARGDLPKGSTVTIRGQAATMSSAYQQLLIGLAFSIVLIYLLIVVNFQSWLDPFVIIMALPAALAGIVWMLFLTHTSLSVPALTGAIMCMGVATANSILVVSFAREQLAEGKDAVEAALAAGATRFRPVLMTALAMIIGMAPMAIEPGQNSPLGRAVIGGLLFATFATLLFVPTVFSIAHRRQPSKAKADAQSRSPACPLTPDPEPSCPLNRPPLRRKRAVSCFSSAFSRSAPSALPSPASPIAPRAHRRSRPGPTPRPFRPCGSCGLNADPENRNWFCRAMSPRSSPALFSRAPAAISPRGTRTLAPM